MKKLELKQLSSFIGGEYYCTYYSDGSVSCYDDSAWEGEFYNWYSWALPAANTGWGSEEAF